MWPFAGWMDGQTVDKQRYEVVKKRKALNKCSKGLATPAEEGGQKTDEGSLPIYLCPLFI